MPSPKAHYEADIEQGVITPDPGQQVAVSLLEAVYDRLTAPQQPWWQRLFFRKQVTEPAGLYLWGGVGIGKTYLMDTFFQCLPFPEKLRMHFHRFMKEVQDRLRALQGTKNPLETVAAEFAAKARVLCFDEFFVSDIGDAMILANLLRALFDRGVVLVATSNVEPSQLYYNGLQRDAFLPAIALLETHTQVHHLKALQDYRLRELARAGVYFQPLGQETTSRLQALLFTQTHGLEKRDARLTIEGREIQTRALGSQIVWFEFGAICSVPRSQVDYLEIARQFHTVIVSGLPKISARETDKATYLIHLVDVLYDARVKLIVSAEVPMDEIYTEGAKVFEFARTLSRLQEMQSREYLHEAHNPR